MRTGRFILVCLLVVLAGIAEMPVAVAWGPNASRAICFCALQVLRQDIDRVFQGREDDLVAGAIVSDRDMSRYAMQGGHIEPFEPIIRQVALLREVNQRGKTDYLAFRFGVLAKMTANGVQPFGVPGNEEEKKLKELLDADIEEHITELKLKYRDEEREFIYYPARYFGEQSKFIEDTEYFIKDEYSQGKAYGDYTRRAVAEYFEDAVKTVADVFYTVLSDRKYFGETPPSPRDIAQYYVGQVEYFLQKSRPDRAEEAYEVFSEVNPRLASPYEELGDTYYRTGYYERAMEEYRRGLRMRGTWPEVEEKIVRHYTEQGAILLSKKTRVALEQARRAYEQALSVSPGHPVAVSGREQARTEIDAMDARLAGDRELLSGAERLFNEGQAASAGKDYARSLDLFEKAAAVFSLVSTEFTEEQNAAQEGGEDAANGIRRIFSAVLGEADGLMNQASQAELDGMYEQAIRLYERVPDPVSVITKKYPEQFEKAQKAIENAKRKKAAAQASLEAQEAESSTTKRR